MLQQSQFSMDSSGPGSIPLAVSARGGVPAPGAAPGVRGLCVGGCWVTHPRLRAAGWELAGAVAVSVTCYAQSGAYLLK